MISQSEVWWADLADPVGSEPGFRRPVVIVQGDPFNRSRIATVVCVALTSNLRWAEAPGNVLLTAKATGLPKDSVANVSQIVTLDGESLVGESESCLRRSSNLSSSASTSCLADEAMSNKRLCRPTTLRGAAERPARSADDGRSPCARRYSSGRMSRWLSSTRMRLTTTQHGDASS